MEGRSLVILKASDLQCSVPGRILFTGFSLEVAAGEAVAVIGPSGSGKSSLLNLILGLTTPDRGSIVINDLTMTGINASERAKIRRSSLGIIFQDGELIPELSAVDNVHVAALMMEADHHGPGPDSNLERAREMLVRMGVPPDTLAANLSGGERQRTAIVRALITNPPLVLADEPTGSLDTETRDDVADELFATVREKECGLVVVTHDPTIAKRADRTIDLGNFAPTVGEESLPPTMEKKHWRKASRRRG